MDQTQSPLLHMYSAKRSQRLHGTDRACSRGFSLLELMVVVAILGALATIGIPGMFKFNRQIQQISLVNNFLGALHQIRSDAITRNQTVKACPIVNQSQTCNKRADRWEGGIASRTVSPDTALRVFSFTSSKNLQIRSHDYADFGNHSNNGQKAPEIRFNSRGGLHSSSIAAGHSGLTFMICHKGIKRKWVRIDASGIIKSVDQPPTGADTTEDCPV